MSTGTCFSPPGLSSQAVEQDQHFQCVRPLISFRHSFEEEMNHVVKCLFFLGTMQVFRAEMRSLTPFSFIWGAPQYLPGLPVAQCRPLRDPVSPGHSLDFPEESKMPQRPLFRWMNPWQIPAQIQVLPPGWNLCKNGAYSMSGGLGQTKPGNIFPRKKTPWKLWQQLLFFKL